MKFSIPKILLSVCILMFFGCAGVKTERTVQDDNIFYSSNKPKIKIKINPDFELHSESGDYDSSRFTPGLGGKMSGVQSYSYLFVDRVSGKPRAAEILIKELVTQNWYFQPELFKMGNSIPSKDIKIKGKNYQCCTYAIQRPDDFLLVQGMGRIVGGRGNAMIAIFYYEQVTGDWSDINKLTASQQKILYNFLEASKKDIQIIE